MKTKLMLGGAAVVVLAALLLLGSGYRVESFSCAKCRNHKRVATRTVMFVELAPQIAVDSRYRAEPDHMHAWWPYASYRQHGPGGLLGKQVTCSPHEYADGKGPDAIAQR